jgi:hypothetical protein
MSTIYSLRDIAKHLNEPFHRVRYAVTEAGIEPAARVGIVRVFTADQIPMIQEALEKSARRELANAGAN